MVKIASDRFPKRIKIIEEKRLYACIERKKKMRSVRWSFEIISLSKNRSITYIELFLLVAHFHLF